MLISHSDVPAVPQSGNLVVGARQFNFSQQAPLFNYTLITPNVVDLAAYQAELASLVQIVQGLVTGQPPWQSPGSPCNSPIPALQGCDCASGAEAVHTSSYHAAHQEM